MLSQHSPRTLVDIKRNDDLAAVSTATAPAVAATAENEPKARKLPSGFAEHVHSIVKVSNPQQEVNGEPGEAALAKAVCAWLSARKIHFECNLEWGVHAVLSGPDGLGDSPGILLAAHMDSDHLSARGLDSLHLSDDQTKLKFAGEVGLDCKTGIAIALSVLDRLKQTWEADTQMPRKWQVHCLFTVGEESGQKGAIRAPLRRLLGGKVRLGYVIDRMTGGSNCPRVGMNPVRHAVSKYKGVPLLEPRSADELLSHLNAGVAIADPEAGARGALPLIESPNCADAIELRGRWDAEVIAPVAMADKTQSKHARDALASAIDTYKQATAELLEKMAKCRPDQRASGMNSHPRMTRYEAMQEVYATLHGNGPEGRGGVCAFDSKLAFSCVNLSYDYDDGASECDLLELDRTANILVGACLSYFKRFAHAQVAN